jgi:hypothetical protein
MSTAKTRPASAGETPTTVKPSAASMKSAATPAAVETSSTTAVTSSMLSKHRLRQPTKRKYRYDGNNDSN